MNRSIFRLSSAISALAFAAADAGGSSHLEELEKDIAERSGDDIETVDEKLDVLSDITGVDKEQVAEFVDEGFKERAADDGVESVAVDDEFNDAEGDEYDLDDDDGDNDDTDFDNGDAPADSN